MTPGEKEKKPANPQRYKKAKGKSFNDFNPADAYRSTLMQDLGIIDPQGEDPDAVDESQYKVRVRLRRANDTYEVVTYNRIKEVSSE